MKAFDEVEQDLLQEIMNQYNQREKVINNNYHIHQHYNCECTICQKQWVTDNLIKQDLKLDSFYDFPKPEEEQSEVDAHNDSFVAQFKLINNLLEAKKKSQQDITEKIHPINLKDPIDFLSVSLKLMSPQKNGKTLNLRIMDTLFFYQREPCLLVYHDKDRNLKILKERHLLTNMLELRNFFINRRFQYDIDLRTSTEKRLNPSFNNLEFDQKSAEIVQRIKKETQKISITTKDFILVKFRNGGMQIMPQLEMMQLFDKRKIDTIWDQIVMIQAYPFDTKGLLTLKQDPHQDKRYIRVHYQKDKIKYEDLFQKALEYICQLNNPNLASTNFQREHDKYQIELKNNLDQFLNYQVYWIIHFFEAYHKRKITKLRVDFAKDDFNNYYVIDCQQLLFVDIHKIKWDEMIIKEISQINPEFKEKIIKEIETNQHNEKMQQQLQQIQPSQNQVRQKYLNQACNEINEHIRATYLQKIEEAEIELKNEGDIDKTNKIFKELNPTISYKFSYLLGIHKEEEEILKKNLINNFPIDKMRFEKQQRYKQDLREMNHKKEQYQRKIRTSASKTNKNLNKYSILQTPQTTKSQQYMIKTLFIPKQRSGMLLQDSRTDDCFQNYYGQKQQQRYPSLAQFKY